MENLLDEVVKVVVIPLLPVIQILVAALVGYAIYRVKKAIKSDELNGYLNILQDLVINVVGEINQTTVDALKQSQGGKLTEEQKVQFYTLARERVLKQLTEAQTKALKQVYSDLDAYVQSLIEKTVRDMKG